MALVNDLQPGQEDIPHEKGEWFKFRPLSHMEIEASRGAKQRKAFQIFDGLDDKTLKVMQGVSADALNAQSESDEPIDPADELDVEIALRHGIVEWSYKAELTPDNLRMLDHITSMWAFDVICKMNTIGTEEKND